MRRTTGLRRGGALLFGVALLLCASAVGVSSAASTHSASNTFRVRQVLLASTVILKGSYYVERPQRCPAEEPSIENDMAWDAWYSDDCEPYRNQEADFIIRVRHKGKLVYLEDTSESSFGSQPYKGAKFEQRIYLFELKITPSCSAGNYYWSVTMIDPYDRIPWNRSRKGGFSIRCR